MMRIELKDVAFAYEGGEPIIADANLSVGGAEVLGIVAPVGGGKSTLIKLCAGLLRPTRGDLLIDGQSFWDLSDSQRNRMRMQMGFDFQEAALIANMSIFDNLALPLRYHGGVARDKMERLIDGWLDRLELAQHRNHLPAALSMGLRRRVSFIRAMIMGRTFFFWDEPTETADRKFYDVIIETIIAKKREGVGAIVTTQNKAFLNAVADRLAVLDGGRIQYAGPLKGGRIPVDISAG